MEDIRHGVEEDVKRVDKRTFLAAATCPSKGWRVFRSRKESLTPAAEWRLHVGNEIGRIAREVLGAGISLPRSSLQGALEATTDVLANPANNLVFEPTFATDQLVARADALRRADGGWDLLEVKSGKLPPDANPEDAKSDYIDDLAFTAMVARAQSLPVARCILVLIRGDYRHGMSQSQLLGELDVTEQVLRRAAEFKELAPRLAAMSRAEAGPDPSLILACKECSFYETHCLGVGVKDPLFSLPRLSVKRFEQLKGYGRISALPPDAELTDAQSRVADVIRSGRPQVEPEGLKHLDAIVWPAYYLDFESIAPAIPWFADSGPYEQMPFQYSIHVCDAPGREPTHHEYLAPLEGDWRGELASRLIEDLGDHGSILMYSSFERRMLNHLATALPHLALALKALERRLYDLEPVFKSGYCHPDFRGRTSIKETLPVLVPDLSYDTLGIHNGDDASGVFALMRVGEYAVRDGARHRENLLAYCKLDTLGMVRLHRALTDIRVGIP